MSSQIQKQISMLGSQAAEVFQREAFKLAVWVGVFGSFSRGGQSETSDIDIVIFYHPDYSENQVWNSYSRCENNRWGTDPDEPKLERLWGRKINTVRIYKGTLRYEKDVEAILHAQTIYGDFNNPVLQGLRSSYYQKLEKYQKKLDDCDALAKKADKVKASQYAYQIASALDFDSGGPLYVIVRTSLNIAKDLSKGGIASQESLEDFWVEVHCAKIRVRRILKAARFADTTRAAK
jgi:predicted nucleotidyltransferase